ncbi:MAG: iron-sulfur cluster assembly protein, partial [Halohasta sp.]
MSEDIYDALRTIRPPEAVSAATTAETDIVSQGIVGEISVEGNEAHIPLAFGAPYSPAETELAAAVRAAVEEAGYEPVLSIEIDDDTPAADGDQPIVIAVSSGKGVVGKSTIA